MRRNLTQNLLAWLQQPARLPMVLRGARQVGKTWLVRDLAARADLDLVEINFERDPQLVQPFAPGNAGRMLGDLELRLGRSIDRRRSLLFLDEVQAAPAALASLRWFAEGTPELSVIAAGSLLEFALADESMRTPVGRVTYRHVEPMSYREFLQAHGQDALLDQLRDWQPGATSSDAVHDAASNWFERYGMIGGMPAVVAADVQHGDPQQCRVVQADLLTAYRDDFRRYAGRMDPALLERVLLAVADQMGNKFVHARVGDGVRQQQVVRALDLLAAAKVVTVAPHSTARAVPLGGSVHLRNKKVILLDVGLAHALLRTPAAKAFPRWQSLASEVRAKLSIQLTGQQLRTLDPAAGLEPMLHYWQRSNGRPGEIDFLVQVEQRIVPVEIKAGAAGAMKSLHQFVQERNLHLALRTDANAPSLQDIAVKTTVGEQVAYRLLNLPGYLLWRAAELLAASAPPH